MHDDREDLRPLGHSRPFKGCHQVRAVAFVAMGDAFMMTEQRLRMARSATLRFFAMRYGIPAASRSNRDLGRVELAPRERAYRLHTLVAVLRARAVVSGSRRTWASRLSRSRAPARSSRSPRIARMPRVTGR